ncbi:MAG: DNA-processing protein DprA, partial [Terriglobia bacterium]
MDTGGIGETKWLAGLSRLSGAATRQLMSIYGSARSAWEAEEPDLVRKVGRKITGQLVAARRDTDLDRLVAELADQGVALTAVATDSRLRSLAEIRDAPVAVFVRGLLAGEGPAVAIVGSRGATVPGCLLAERTSFELAKAGVSVVSGAARGIDTSAHRGALAGGGHTVAVLGCGLDVVYPPENRMLLAKIAGQGAVISEYPLGTEVRPYHFPARNRIISGLAQAVVVVEAALNSGAMITVDLALEQGKEVLAFPGSVRSSVSKGVHRLIKEGAHLVEDADDILEVIGFVRPTPAQVDDLSGNERDL